MREAVGYNPASGLFLKRVVANGSGGSKAFFDITWLNHLAVQICMVCPDTRQIVRLKLQANGILVGLGFALGSSCSLNPGAIAKQVLDVVAHFVSNHISLGEVAGGSKPLVKVPENIIDGYLIAEIELEQKKIPFIIRRPLPNGGSEYWRLNDLQIIAF